VQVDFGQGAWIEAEGRRRRPQLFRAVLSHFRKGGSEVVWRQDTEALIRCCENVFPHFGGVTRTTVVDNMKAAVLDADGFDPGLNPKKADFARHYGPVVLPTQPARPEHKGKIEAGVKYPRSPATCRTDVAEARAATETTVGGDRHMKTTSKWVRLFVRKDTAVVAVAEGGREGEACRYGEISSDLRFLNGDRCRKKGHVATNDNELELIVPRRASSVSDTRGGPCAPRGRAGPAPPETARPRSGRPKHEPTPTRSWKLRCAPPPREYLA
jgi:hypothetical protein